MTHCNEGDFTWRYRLLEWFNAQNIAIRYVGPYAGTIAPPAPGPPQKPALYRESPTASSANTDGGYNLGIKSLGDLRHFAISGRAAATDQHLIEQVARDYPADLMLIKLGFNDLGWFYSDDKGLITNMRNLINNARRARPNMRFVVATVVHRTFIGGREDLVTMTDSYNRMLKAQIGEWSTPSSPVTWAPVREEYDCGPKYPQDCPAAYDGLHPNELGEYQIARGFSRALVSGLGIGKTPLEVPGTIPSRSLPTPGNFQMSSSDLGVTATWDKVYGAYSYDVEYIINGGAPYNFSPGSVKSNRWDSRWAAEGWTYEVRIRASAGNRKGPWTTWYSATAHPHTASAPTNVVTRPTASGIDVSWTGSTGLYSDTVSQYNVYFWDQDQPCAFLLSGGFLPGGSASIIDLVPGHRYLVAIEAWNAAGAGFPLVARRVVPGRGQPPTVSGLQVDTVDPTTAHLTWNTIPGAAGYRYWRRNFNQAGSQLVPLGSLDENCINVYFQLPGTWNY
ncbi:SGNH hydrolase-type esterase domain-containing protein, partial [Leptodontidium sp. MPI-SDFR-AT-0119]